MHKTSRLLLAVLIIVLAGIVPAPAAEFPTRIVSLSPALTRQLCELGQKHRLVGVTSYHCPATGDVAVVGNLTSPNIEAILALHPDIVLAATDCNQKRDVEKLIKLGLSVEVFDGCEDLPSIFSSYQRLADIVGCSAIAEQQIKETKAEIDRIGRQLSAGPARRIFWQLGSSPLVSANDKTLAGEFIHALRATNVFGDAPSRYPRVNVEEVLARNPDTIIIVSGMGRQTDWKQFPSLQAVASNRVFTVEADALCQPTPAMFLKGLRLLTPLMQSGD